jgi:hypothetical protein
MLLQLLHATEEIRSLRAELIKRRGLTLHGHDQI